jgi:hypothetical protein
MKEIIKSLHNKHTLKIMNKMIIKYNNNKNKCTNDYKV